MYDLMIEELKGDRTTYERQRDEMLRNGQYGIPLRIVNTRIEMTNRFIAFLKRCELQEIELEKENRRLRTAAPDD